MAQVAGFAVGGLLVAWLSPVGALAVNAASFALSAVLLAALPPLRPAADGARLATGRGRLLIDASRGMIADPVVRHAVALGTVCGAVAVALTAQVAAWVAAEMPGRLWIAGLVPAAGAVVSAVGTVVAARGSTAMRLQRAQRLGVGTCVAVLVLLAVPLPAARAAALVLAGLLVVPLVLANTVVAPRLAPARRASAIAVLMGLLTFAQLLLTAGAGLVAGRLSPAGGLTVCAAAGAFGCAALAVTGRRSGVARALAADS